MGIFEVMQKTIAFIVSFFCLMVCNTGLGFAQNDVSYVTLGSHTDDVESVAVSGKDAGKAGSYAAGAGGSAPYRSGGCADHGSRFGATPTRSSCAALFQAMRRFDRDAIGAGWAFCTVRQAGDT